MTKTDQYINDVSECFKNNDKIIFDIANKIPASLMIHDIENNEIVRCSYMNKWGCEYLKTTPQEINDLGKEYYNRYFFIEEIQDYLNDITKFITKEDLDNHYNFFQRVKAHGEEEPAWFYTVCKITQSDHLNTNSKKLIVLSSPVIGFNSLINRVNKTLNLEGYIGSNFKKFSLLTAREKQIMILLAKGLSSNEIAEKLFIYNYTVSTHRRNLIKKINCKSRTELIRFAIAFELIE